MCGRRERGSAVCDILINVASSTKVVDSWLQFNNARNQKNEVMPTKHETVTLDDTLQTSLSHDYKKRFVDIST